MPRRLSVVRVVLGAGLVVAMAGFEVGAEEGTNGPSVRDGIYTEAQADRGRTTFNQRCAACHGENLGGTPGGPDLIDANFQYAFGGRTVADLFAYMKLGMPPEAPGSLTDQQYTNIAAHILRGNGFPPGETDMPADFEILSTLSIPKD